MAAGVATTPEASAHTSFRARLDHCRDQGAIDSVRDDLSNLTHDPAQEQNGWLLPINDLRGEGTTRAGLMRGLTLSCDVRLVDWTSRPLREGKAAVPADAAPIFQRLGTDPHEWGTTAAELLSRPKPTGSHARQGSPRGLRCLRLEPRLRPLSRSLPVSLPPERTTRLAHGRRPTLPSSHRPVPPCAVFAADPPCPTRIDHCSRQSFIAPESPSLNPAESVN
jgi:hypothetical protein